MKSSPPDRQQWSQFFLPFLSWWPRVTRRTLKADILAGATGAIVALPQGVAFAAIAGMPPEYGLYAGMVPAVIAALFGSSWHLVSGPTTAASIVMYSALSEHAAPGSAHYIQLALTLTMMVGLIQLSMGLVRFGVIVNFISHSVVVGFTAGAAILIMASQLKHSLGLTLPRTADLPQTLYAVFSHWQDINIYAVATGLTTIMAGLLVKRFRPKFPYIVVSMLVGIGTGLLLNMLFGPQTTKIACVGALPSSLPPLSAPEFTLGNIRLLAPAALATTLFALTEAVSIARSLADKTGQDLDGNQEFIGQGLSNIIGSFFSGYVATGSFNRSGLNYQAGAKTPLAAIFAGLLLVVLVLLVAPLATYLPLSVMAGILLLVAWGLIDFAKIRKILQASTYETLILCSTFFATLFLQLEFAIFLGFMLSLVIYLNRTSHPHIRVRVPDPRLPNHPFTTDIRLPECPQFKIVRIDGSLYFGAISHVRKILFALLRKYPNQKHLLIVASGINLIDMTGAELLMELTRELKDRNGQLYLYDIKENVCDHFKFYEYLLEIGAENIYESKVEAISGIFDRLDKEICQHCQIRIFRECATIPYVLEAFPVTLNATT
ncbi:MAG: SulP family inorganic anion transporter [Desulfoprunum sp.]|nr:SulP family inorganic anion transporter [Desulfoprunum sp.]